jgi:pyruvate dehydrogenase E1 component alpha subunit/2-oxoisovalerate dehydrogenase E1 component alpha subunit
MQLNRQLEELMEVMFRQNKIVGGLYSSLGQEATSVGTTYALEPRDWIAPMIRNLGSVLVKGFRPRDILMQYTAKDGSPTGGKDGTAHFGDLKKNHVIAPISMLGDLIPVMTGIGLGARYLGRDEVAMTWIGDGGSSTGVFHEGLNFAAVQRAPLVLVLENNQWAYSTPSYLQSRLTDFADRAKAYGIPAMIVDGNDVVAVYETTKTAIDMCRRGDGPVLIESKTFRRRGHAQHDPAKYVPEWMLKEWEAKDPITNYEKYLTKKNLWTAKDKKEILARIDRELKEEQKAAEASPLPPAERAAEGVYCEDGCHKIEPVWARQPKAAANPGNGKAEWFTGRQPAHAPNPNGSRKSAKQKQKRQKQRKQKK